MKRIYLTDKEVAAVLEVSSRTLYRMLHGFYRKEVKGRNRVDIRKMQPEVVNGVRRWRIAHVASVLGVSEDAIHDRIS